MVFWSQSQFQKSQDNKRSQPAELYGGTEGKRTPTLLQCGEGQWKNCLGLSEAYEPFFCQRSLSLFKDYLKPFF